MIFREGAFYFKLVIILFFIQINFISCSRLQQYLNHNNVKTISPNDKSHDLPFKVSVSQAFYVSGKLNIKVLLESLSYFPSSEVMVKVSGLKNGKVVEEQQKIVSEFSEETELKLGERLIIPFIMQNEEFTEYQIQCSWGEDAKSNIKQSKVSELTKSLPVESKLIFDEVSISEENTTCSNRDCPKKFNLNVLLKSQYLENIYKIRLAVGILWVEDNKITKVIKDFEPKQEAEELVDLGDFILSPKASKRIKVNIDREVPRLSSGRYYPYIRIVEFNSK